MTAIATRALLIATALAAALSAAPAWAGAAEVTVVFPGGAQQAVSLDALAGSEDVVGVSYAMRSAAGPSRVTVTGFSLAALIEAAGADPYSFSHLEVRRPAGGAVLLSRHQALDRSAFADGPPVVHATASGTAFLRPSAGAGDLNARDCFESPQGITIILRKGSPLRVRATASTRRTRPGEAVTFTASVEGAGSGERVEYSWYFDDGGAASGPRVRHAFSRRGSYDVVVGVTTPGNDTGASAVVRVQVGAPIDGPDRKGGGRNRDSRAPDHGAASGAGGASPGSGAGAAGASGTPAVPSADAAPAAPRRPRPVPPSTDGRTVTGLLLSSSAPLPERRAAPAARTGRPEEGDEDGPLFSDTALGLLAAVGLLGLGALGEIRGFPR